MATEHHETYLARYGALELKRRKAAGQLTDADREFMETVERLSEMIEPEEEMELAAAQFLAQRAAAVLAPSPAGAVRAAAALAGRGAGGSARQRVAAESGGGNRVFIRAATGERQQATSTPQSLYDILCAARQLGHSEVRIKELFDLPSSAEGGEGVLFRFSRGRTDMVRLCAPAGISIPYQLGAAFSGALASGQEMELRLSILRQGLALQLCLAPGGQRIESLGLSRA